MGKNEKEDGIVKPWRELVEADPNCGRQMVLDALVSDSTTGRSFAEECEDPESDGDGAVATTTANEVFAAEEAPPPDFEELAADEEGESDEEYEPQAMLMDSRKRSRRTEYLVHWKGYQKSEATWEPHSHIASCKSMFKRWQQSSGNDMNATTRKRKKSGTGTNKKKKKR